MNAEAKVKLGKNGDGPFNEVRRRAHIRETILLYYYQGYGIGEIAKMLELPEGTISSRLSRGRKKLEELLKERGIEP